MISYVLIGIATILALIVGFISFLFLEIYSINGFGEALEGVLLFSSITLGFYGACLSVLASVINKEIVQEIINNNIEKKQLVCVMALTLLSGFSTVVTTIIYQVILTNGQLTERILNIVNSFWLLSLTFYLLILFLFVALAFYLLLYKEDKVRVDEGKIGKKR